MIGLGFILTNRTTLGTQRLELVNMKPPVNDKKGNLKAVFYWLVGLVFILHNHKVLGLETESGGLCLLKG